MSSDTSFLALQLVGPMQSYGFDSHYNRRNTGLMPTKSAIAGMCCAALGLARGCEAENEFLSAFKGVKMTAIAIPRWKNIGRSLPVRRLQDYHTVQNTRTAEGKTKDCHITHRQYLTDAAFGVVLEGETSFLKKIADAFIDPVWGVWLGRKTCIPSSPVLVGLKETSSGALHLLIGDCPLDSFTRQVEIECFEEGRDSILDAPVSFAIERRLYAHRRVLTIPANVSSSGVLKEKTPSEELP